MTARLRAYLDRIGLEARPAADPQGLAALQVAHRRAIAFENFDIPLGRGIRIGADAVFAKLVEAKRGGYCFEQNRLFADMLEALGMANRPLLARVRLAAVEGAVPVRSHVLLLADLDGEEWIADVGFGGSFVPPMQLVDGEAVATPDGARHRLRHVGLPDGEWLLERSGPRENTDGRVGPGGEWQAQYTFDLAHVEQADLDQANHWTATAPQSRFVAGPVASIVLPRGFASLSGGTLNIAEGQSAQKREISDPAEWGGVLADIFDIHLTQGEIAQLFPRP